MRGMKSECHFLPSFIIPFKRSR